MAMKSNPVIWFELPVKDMARARKFYEAVLDLTLSPVTEMLGMKLSFFPMERDVVGAGGALILSDQAKPSQSGTIVYFSVPIDTVLQRVEPAGGTISLPRTSIGEYGFVAHVVDTEGNRIGLHEPAPM